MMRRTIRQAVQISFIATLAFPLFSVAQSAAGNGKKIYADYHGVRYSREHDGKLGRWSYYKQIVNSRSAIKILCYNADNILENEQNEIASVDYPLAGLQSDLDPDYIEYQVLTAKAAKIDGFFIEWGFPEHESNTLLKAFQTIAAKYKFEIGVNWCDGWLYYDWITKINPQINTREAKTAHFKYCLQYLIDSVFSVSTAPLVKGIPVYYSFGGGITANEYAQTINGQMHLPAATKLPVALRRFLLKPVLDSNDEYTAPPAQEEFTPWTNFGMSPTAWIPLRIRPAGNKYPNQDFYGTQHDAINYMHTYKEFWDDSVNYHVPVKSGFAVPGMDNRGCAGWGHDQFYIIPRNDGHYYENYWKYNMASKDELDMLFIASWSDFTEGHEIQPTVENGYRELRTTLRYAAVFKEQAWSEKGLVLPLQLFMHRKKMRFLQNAGVNVDTELVNKPDSIGQLISSANYAAAAIQLLQVKDQLDVLEKTSLISERINPQLLVNGKKQDKNAYTAAGNLRISIPETTATLLDKYYYAGYIKFDYQDTGVLKDMTIYSGTPKADKAFSVVAQIKTANTGAWKKAKIALFKSNIKFIDGNSLLIKMQEGLAVKNVALNFTVYKKRGEGS